jgi:hypothetical protein
MDARRYPLVIAALLASFGLATPASSAASSLGYWRFEEGIANAAASGSGSILDSSGSGDLGTPSGGPIYRTDVPADPVPATRATNELSLQFDGVDDQVAYASTFPFHQAGDATLEFWLKFSPTSHQGVFWTRIGSDDLNRFNIFVNGNGTFGFDYRSPSGELHMLVGAAGQGVPLPANTWTHLAITRSGTHYSLYRNGSLVARLTTALLTFRHRPAGRSPAARAIASTDWSTRCAYPAARCRRHSSLSARRVSSTLRRSWAPRPPT